MQSGTLTGVKTSRVLFKGTTNLIFYNCVPIGTVFVLAGWEKHSKVYKPLWIYSLWANCIGFKNIDIWNIVHLRQPIYWQNLFFFHCGQTLVTGLHDYDQTTDFEQISIAIAVDRHPISQQSRPTNCHCQSDQRSTDNIHWEWVIVHFMGHLVVDRQVEFQNWHKTRRTNMTRCQIWGTIELHRDSILRVLSEW